MRHPNEDLCRGFYTSVFITFSAANDLETNMNGRIFLVMAVPASSVPADDLLSRIPATVFACVGRTGKKPGR